MKFFGGNMYVPSNPLIAFKYPFLFPLFSYPIYPSFSVFFRFLLFLTLCYFQGHSGRGGVLEAREEPLQEAVPS